MKNVFTLLALVLLNGALKAQDVQFVDGNGDALPDTLTIMYDQNDAYLDEHDNLSYYDGFLKNNSLSDISLVLSREVLAYVTDSVEVDQWGEKVWKKPQDQFCWGLCYLYNATNQNVDLGPNALATGVAEPLEKIVHYTHYKIPGTTTIKYSAKNGLKTEDELVIRFTINKTVGTKENSLQQVSLFPNPCESKINLTNLSGVKSLVISNILGQPVYTLNDLSLNMQLNMADYNKGIYFITLIDADNNTRTERIIKQ